MATSSEGAFRPAHSSVSKGRERSLSQEDSRRRDHGLRLGVDPCDGSLSNSDVSSVSSHAGGDVDDQVRTTSGPAPRTIPAVPRSDTGFPLGREHDSAVKHLARLTLDPHFSHTKGRVSKRDGRLKLNINETVNRGFLAKLLGTSLKQHLTSTGHPDHEGLCKPPASGVFGAGQAPPRAEPAEIPRLNIVIMVIGSRGDIQPFVKVGKILGEKYGHRVRIATHPAFKDFVERDSGLEHFSIGGDPLELMVFMVKNPGLIPSFDTLKKGEVGRRRAQMAGMFEGFWSACVNDSGTTPESGIDPFVADAIIANPPSFAHVHCAERLGVPLHIMFTFPYTPTTKFPHPLANIKTTNVDESYTNFMSYPLVELMTWQGLGDLCNHFRVKTLGLDPVSTIWAPGNLHRLKVPYTYLWSPGLVPKPQDWGPEIDIAGFVFLDLASSFEPPEDLERFLGSGEPPIYIGFGSIVVDDPGKFTSLVFDAVSRAGVRAVVSRGWGGFGTNIDVPSNVFMLDNVPHDFLFKRTKAVVHHGGAGTTAIGLKLAKPTVIVPFFGDQPFWGSMVAASGAGRCLPYKHLTAQELAEGIKYCLSVEAQASVQKIADCIGADGDGAENAVKSFHASLPLQGPNPMRCSVLGNRVAAWQLKKSNLRLSSLAAELLVQQGKVKYEQLHLRRQVRRPVTGGVSAVVGSISGVGKSIGDGPVVASKDINKRIRHGKNKIRHMRRERERETSFKGRDGRAGKKTVDTESTRPEKLERPPTDVTGSELLSSQGAEDPQQHGAPRTDEPADGQAPQRQDTNTSVVSADPSESLAITVTRDITHGLKDPIEAAAMFPMDLFVGLTNGFHNAPRLYGDKTVRRPERIQGFQSGVRAASSELAFGTYDAVTGVVTQPFNGAKEDGPLGFAAGVGKGIGGLVLKESAALSAPISYTMQGIYKEITKSRTPIVQIREARMSQGHMEVAKLDGGKRERALQAASKGWTFMKKLWEQGEMVKSGELGPDGKPLPENPTWAGGKVVAEVKGRYEYNRKKKYLENTGAFEDVERTQEAMTNRISNKDIESQGCTSHRE